jgi:hypothetical protein
MGRMGSTAERGDAVASQLFLDFHPSELLYVVNLTSRGTAVGHHGRNTMASRLGVYGMMPRGRISVVSCSYHKHA